MYVREAYLSFPEGRNQVKQEGGMISNLEPVDRGSMQEGVVLASMPHVKEGDKDSDVASIEYTDGLEDSQETVFETSSNQQAVVLKVGCRALISLLGVCAVEESMSNVVLVVSDHAPLNVGEIVICGVGVLAVIWALNVYEKGKQFMHHVGRSRRGQHAFLEQIQQRLENRES